jgi:amino acid transporter
METNDVEKASVSESKKSTLPSHISNESHPAHEQIASTWRNFGRRVFGSFKRDSNLAATPRGVVGGNGRVFNPENAAVATAASPLARKLKGRHLQMITIGGSIGNSPFEVFWTSP